VKEKDEEIEELKCKLQAARKRWINSSTEEPGRRDPVH
jgi:hypothetical protein